MPSGEARPFHGLGVVLRHALTGVVQESEIVLSVSIALVGCEMIPLHGLSVPTFQPTPHEWISMNCSELPTTISTLDFMAASVQRDGLLSCF
jgi:hypothetical protein